MSWERVDDSLWFIRSMAECMRDCDDPKVRARLDELATELSAVAEQAHKGSWDAYKARDLGAKVEPLSFEGVRLNLPHVASVPCKPFADKEAVSLHSFSVDCHQCDGSGIDMLTAEQLRNVSPEDHDGANDCAYCLGEGQVIVNGTGTYAGPSVTPEQPESVLADWGPSDPFSDAE